jgi:inosose dehydratase
VIGARSGAAEPASPAAASDRSARPSTSGSDGGRPARSRLPRARVGIVPIVWNNADLGDLAPRVPVEVILDEAARLGYEGVQDGVGFPSGPALRDALERRGLALAEMYVALPCGPDGPGGDALAAGRTRLAELDHAGGDVLVVALAFSAGRIEPAGRADASGAPSLSENGWRALASTLEGLGADARDMGHGLAFHGHAGTYIETPMELERLMAMTDPALVGLCLDTGHITVGGGDAVAVADRYRERIVHVHLKDVAAATLQRMRGGAIGGFLDALRERIFCELGSGVVDLEGVLDALARWDYAGWLMVEQDTTWGPPTESAAIGRRVLEFALRSRRADGRP